MIYFQCDYTEGAHPEIMKRLNETNFEQTPGYGTDYHCDRARQLIRTYCNAPDASVEFLVGGTQANALVIAAALRPHQGVISCDSGHINVHESGAIESYGHKVLTVPGHLGKLTAKQIDDTIVGHYEDPTAEHMVQPGMVYISFPTEAGTLYSKAELTAISEVCRKHDVPLFVDGARMGYGLMSEENDLTLEDFAKLTDVFYIGGTKVGALFGEAIVITNNSLKKDFRYLIKQHGGMLAKGRLLGIQFETLFEPTETGCLYADISGHAIQQAMRIKQAFAEAGFEFAPESPTNQQFPVLNQAQIDQLKDDYAFEIFSKLGEDAYQVRFCTSWATVAENVDKLIEDIKKLK